jgi:hypothetical protein
MNRVLKNNKNHPMAMLMVGNKMWKVMLAANCNRANKSGSRASIFISFGRVLRECFELRGGDLAAR